MRVRQYEVQPNREAWGTIAMIIGAIIFIYGVGSAFVYLGPYTPEMGGMLYHGEVLMHGFTVSMIGAVIALILYVVGNSLFEIEEVE